MTKRERERRRSERERQRTEEEDGDPQEPRQPTLGELVVASRKPQLDLKKLLRGR